MKQKLFQIIFTVLASASAHAQVNSGSNGSDGALNPATNIVINMADHPDGIYQYTSVNISNGVTVTFIPNANNTPVVWLVQGSNIINGVVDVSGKDIDFSNQGAGRIGGPGGFRGGSAAGGGALPGDGLGPGGGKAPSTASSGGGNASHATSGVTQSGSGLPGEVYGNSYLLPLIGGSGGGGGFNGYGGLGGGGAILIASSTEIVINGTISAKGGGNYGNVGNGSGGSVRLIATMIRGSGTIDASASPSQAGQGRVRFDAFENTFAGTTQGVVTRGYQPIIIPPANQAISLAIQSVAGIAVAANPTASLTTPDVIVPSSQQNPVSIVVRCINIPLNTDVIVDIKPANGPTVRVVGVNNAGTQASSTATISVTMPRGAGTIQAKAVSGIAGSLGANLKKGEKFRHYAQTGLTAEGELFEKMEITATLGKGQEIAYITESGKRFVLPRN